MEEKQKPISGKESEPGQETHKASERDVHSWKLSSRRELIFYTMVGLPKREFPDS